MTTVLSVKRKKGTDPARLAELKQKINNEEYIYGAIFRIAQVVSNEILGIPQGGEQNARQWERGGKASKA
jgi:hypothetical protein